MKNIINFSFVPTRNFYSSFITLNFTQWLKILNIITLPIWHNKQFIIINNKISLKIAYIKIQISTTLTSWTYHLRSSHSAIPSPVCAKGTSTIFPTGISKTDWAEKQYPLTCLKLNYKTEIQQGPYWNSLNLLIIIMHVVTD
jgi:hypothetical protein